MAINQVKFGEANGREVYAYTLTNGKGLSAEILNYGGIIRKLVFKGVDVVLGRDSLEEYFNNEGYFGALIGRNSNRIEASKFTLNGETYQLFPNDGENNLHGGKVGFDKKVWDAETIDGEEPALLLSLVSPDGEEGFPGTVKVQVRYTIKADNSIEIHYTGEGDRDTVLNMTNHAYFNLNGHDSGAVDGHTVSLECDFYTPNNGQCMPTGEVLSVKGTPFDFSSEETLGERFATNDPQLAMFGGFDHNFALKGEGYRRVGTFVGDKTGIQMEIYTDQKGIQIYSGNWIEEERVCKDGVVYGKHHAVCFETQAFPNSINFSHFPGAILKQGEKYDTVTSYRFI